jgi:hypothetical protein
VPEERLQGRSKESMFSVTNTSRSSRILISLPDSKRTEPNRTDAIQYNTIQHDTIQRPNEQIAKENERYDCNVNMSYSNSELCNIPGDPSIRQIQGNVGCAPHINSIKCVWESDVIWIWMQNSISGWRSAWSHRTIRKQCFGSAARPGEKATEHVKNQSVFRLKRISFIHVIIITPPDSNRYNTTQYNTNIK